MNFSPDVISTTANWIKSILEIVPKRAIRAISFKKYICLIIFVNKLFIDVKERSKYCQKTSFNLRLSHFQILHRSLLTLVSKFFVKFCEFFLINILSSADSDKTSEM